MAFDVFDKLKILHAATTQGLWYARSADDGMYMSCAYVRTNKDGYASPSEIPNEVVAVTLFQEFRVASHDSLCWFEDSLFIAIAHNIFPILLGMCEAYKNGDMAMAKAAVRDLETSLRESVYDLAEHRHCGLWKVFGENVLDKFQE